ncbi:MAG TPA: crossover junction endodeoxyribonuclease RuvC [Candidatus Limnocylindrales bacterium]
MIILGIDPGTAMLGYGLVERTGPRLRAIDYGVIRTPAQMELPERLESIYLALTDLIELHVPTLVGVERLFFTRNAQTAFAVGQARGVVLLAAAMHDLEIREATPNEVKVATAGDGSASKAQVQRMVQAILGLRELPEPDDAADALAIAICVANRERSVSRISTGALDKSALKPAPDGVTPYEKAVREALRRERLGIGPAGQASRLPKSRTAS